MFRHRLISILSFVLLFVPRVVRAQAGELTDHFLGWAFGDVLEAVLGIVNLFIIVASFFMGIAMSWIGIVMEWQVASNNEVVLVSWAMARDISNIFFIVGLIIIAFATMFRTFGVLQSFHWKSALPRLLMAAILINLSLAMSQTVVLISNRVTDIMGGILENSGFELARVLKVSTLRDNLHVVLSNDRAVAQGLTALDPDAQAQFNTPEVQAALEDCQTMESRINATWWQSMVDKIPRMAIGVVTGPVGFIVSATLPATSFDANFDTGGVRKTYQECVAEYIAKQGGFTARFAAEASALLEWAGNTKISTILYMIIMGVLNLFMVAMVLISLGSAIVFYMFRVMAIWVLLFFSAFAFGFAWLPGAQSLKRWWNIFLGWNVFGPMYLFFLIIGMSFLVRQGDLVAALDQSTDVGVIGGLFQIIFFYVFAAIVFVGGLTIALNSSFAAAVKSTPLIGKGVERFGAFSATAWSRAFGRRVAQATRVPAYFQAARERAAQEYRERRPELLRLKTQEEMTAAARARLGVQGGAMELESLRQGRIKDVSGRMKKSLDEINVFDKNTGLLDMGLTHQARMKFLKDRMNSRNKDEAFAARKELLKYGDPSMGVTEIEETINDLPKGPARAEFLNDLQKGDKIDPLTQYNWQQHSKPLPPGEAAEKFFGSILRDPSKFKKLSPAYVNASIPGNVRSQAQNIMGQAANRIWPKSSNPKIQRNRDRAMNKLLNAPGLTPEHRQFILDVFQ